MRKVKCPPDRFDVKINIPFDPYFQSPKRPRALVLLMHGYGQSGPYIADKLADQFPEDFAILSPNAPFPLYHWDAPFPSPGWRERKVRMGYTWYFYDSRTNEYFVDMQPAIEFLSEGVKKLDLTEMPKIVIGFSQGGYVAPSIAQKLKNVIQVIGLSCEFLPDDLEGEIPFRVDAIFGDSDDIADIEAARNSHQQLKSKKQVAGEFHVVSGVAHEISEPVQNQVKRILAL